MPVGIGLDDRHDRGSAALTQPAEIGPVGVEIDFQYAAGKTRDLEMVLEDGAWKLNLFSS